MLPTRSDVHVSRPLTNMSIAQIQSESAFIHRKVFPLCPVLKQNDRYFRFPKDYWYRTQAAVRADGEESVGAGFHIDNRPSYNCDVVAVHKRVGDQLRANVDSPLDIDKVVTQFVTHQNLLKREIDFVTRYLKPGVWGGWATPGTDFQPGVDGAGQWDTANSNPLTDVDKIISRMARTTSFKPNKLVLGDNVFRAVKNNAQVIDRIKYTQRGLVTPELLAPLFGVEEVVIAEAVVNNAPEGKPADMSFVTGNKFLLCYAAPAPALMWPSAGYIFTWQGLFGADAMGARISNIREPLRKADRIESEMAYDMGIVCEDMGVLGINVLATP